MCNFKKSKLLCKIMREKRKLNQKHTTTNDKKNKYKIQYVYKYKSQIVFFRKYFSLF